MLTEPKAAALQFVFGEQKNTRLKRLPIDASNRSFLWSAIGNTLKMFEIFAVVREIAHRIVSPDRVPELEWTGVASRQPD